MVSLDSKIHAKFAVLGVDFKGLEWINPFCITFYGGTMPRFSNVSELKWFSGMDYIRKPRYHYLGGPGRVSCRKDTVGTAVLLKSESHVRVLRQEPGLPQGHAAIVPAARPLALPMSPREPRHLSWWPNLPASGVQLWCPECTCSRANTGCGTARGVRLPSMGPPGGAQIWVRQTALTQDLPFPAFANASCSGRPPSDFLSLSGGRL